MSIIGAGSAIFQFLFRGSRLDQGGAAPHPISPREIKNECAAATLWPSVDLAGAMVDWR